MRAFVAVLGRRLGPGGVVGWPHAGAVAVAAPYLDALERAGLDYAIVHPVAGAEAQDVARVLARFDGVVLVGGSDVDPARYGAPAHPKTVTGDPVQDDYELRAVDAVLKLERPLLAICRGVQVLNIALGGTLIQHLPDRPGTGQHTVAGASEAGGRLEHLVTLEPESIAARVMGTARPRCPSSHHQAIDDVGKDLVVTGWSDDGVIEAVEHRDGWIVGVQWHPESSAATDPAQQALFDGFAAACVRRRRVA